MKRAHRIEIAVDELLSRAQADLLSIDDGGRDNAEPLARLCLGAEDRLIARAQGHASGLPTGFADIDNLTAGLGNGDLLLLAARPSMGKTALALNIARNVAGAGHGVLFFSLEMSSVQLFERLLAAESGVNSHRIRTGRLNTEDWDGIAAAQGTLHDLPIFIDDSPGLHVSELRCRARRQGRAQAIRLVIVDYLQLLAGERQHGRTEEVSSISRNLKLLARELELPVLALSQLSRNCEGRDDKRPRLSDLRDSGALEQDADVVAFIYREGVYNRKAEPDLAEVQIAKHRNGPTGTVALQFSRRTTRFYDRKEA